MSKNIEVAAWHQKATARRERAKKILLENPLISSKELARFTGCTLQSAYNWKRRYGVLPIERIYPQI